MNLQLVADNTQSLDRLPISTATAGAFGEADLLLPLEEALCLLREANSEQELAIRMASAAVQMTGAESAELYLKYDEEWQQAVVVGDTQGKADHPDAESDAPALVLPLSASDGEEIALLVLNNVPVARSRNLKRQLQLFAGHAVLALEARQQYRAQHELFESFIHVIAEAIDAKSPHTGRHCQRVPVLHEMIADAAAAQTDGPFSTFSLNESERRELRGAAWLHDCGKIVVPEHLMDKATRLEGLRDGMGEVLARFEVMRRDLELDFLHAERQDPENCECHRRDHEQALADLEYGRDLIQRLNRPQNSADENDEIQLRRLAHMSWRDGDGERRPLLEAGELENLLIRCGTLNDSERQTVNSHADLTIRMLERLKLPRQLRQVPEIAGAHHEMHDGSGYPRGLSGDEMSLPARMLVIADIFEALTAPDRPYKQAKSLAEAVSILAEMRDGGKIDPDLFDLFLHSGVWRDYAEKYMAPELIDAVDAAQFQTGKQ